MHKLQDAKHVGSPRSHQSSARITGRTHKLVSDSDRMILVVSKVFTGRVLEPAGFGLAVSGKLDYVVYTFFIAPYSYV